MVFVHSKTIINKLDEAHGLIITYPEFKVIDCGDFKTDDKIGIYYKIEADERNGITPPHGRKTWFKHFVVMGISDDGSLMGCVVFDSEKNREHIEPGYDEFFIPISQGKYSFIDHDSFLECLRLKPATLSNIRHGKAEGRLTEDDLQKALELTKKSNRNSIITLKAYNIR